MSTPLADALSTPFDALFLALYFIQIYMLQLILQVLARVRCHAMSCVCYIDRRVARCQAE